jgi:hypothetical protein
MSVDFFMLQPSIATSNRMLYSSINFNTNITYSNKIDSQLHTVKTTSKILAIFQATLKFSGEQTLTQMMSPLK